MRRHLKQSPLIKTAVRAKNMAMGVESQQISKRLDGNGRSRHSISLWNRFPEKHPQGFPSTTTQFRKERTIVEEITSKDLGDAEDKMTMDMG